jgi:hypothetical protein
MALSDSSEFSVAKLTPVKDINGNTAARTEDLGVEANTADTTPPQVVADTIKYDMDYDGFVSTSADDLGFFTTSIAGYRVFLEFNEVMSKADVENGNAWYADDPAYKPSTVRLQDDGRTVELYFSTYATLFGFDVVPMATDSRLNIGINNLITDMNQNSMDTLMDQVIKPHPNDDTRPTIESLTWQSNFGGDGYEVVVTFNEVIDHPSGSQRRHYKLSDFPYSTVEKGTPDTAEFSTFIYDGRRILLRFFEQTSDGFYNGTGVLGNDDIDIGLANTIMDINGNTMREVLGQDIVSNPSDSTQASAPFLLAMQWRANEDQYIADLEFDESMNIESAMFNPETYLISETENVAGDADDDVFPFRVALKLDEEGRFDGRTISLFFQGYVFTSLLEDGDEIFNGEGIIVSDEDEMFDALGNFVKGVRDINLNPYPNSNMAGNEALRAFILPNPDDVTPPEVVGNPTAFYDNIEEQYVVTTTFNEVMDAETVNENGIMFLPPAPPGEEAEPLGAQTVLLPGGLTAQSVFGLEEGVALEDITVEVTEFLRDINGVSIEADTFVITSD